MNEFTKGEWKVKYGHELNGIKSASVWYPHGFLTSANVIKVSDEQLEGESWLDMRERTEPDRVQAATESNANMELIATAGTTATKLAEMGYDAVKVLEVLPDLITAIELDCGSDMRKLLEECRGE